jgi:hypothetical protein
MRAMMPPSQATRTRLSGCTAMGCPWNVDTILSVAALAGHASVLAYVHSVQHLSPLQLSELLRAVGAFTTVPVAKWLRQAGAEWPAVLQYDGLYWQGDVLAWARAEGCASLTHTQQQLIEQHWQLHGFDGNFM